MYLGNQGQITPSATSQSIWGILGTIHLIGGMLFFKYMLYLFY